ncbi:MAG: CHAP domain-containing protein [Lachnospiraceae bacterium]|nr:CHAP domain-containing protein [Lachnospiraceae bacterium]
MATRAIDTKDVPEAALQIVNTALKEVGVYESPPNSNNVKYNTWYYKRAVSGSSYPWCMVFCLWVYDQCKAKLPGNSASCTQMMNDAKKAGMFVTKNYQPGDLMLMDFQNKGTPQHCGIFDFEDSFAYHTIEGNTSLGNDANGGMVMRRERRKTLIIGAVRPVYSDGGVNMTKAEFLKSLTDEEAYALLKKAMSYADKQKEPDWSKKEGHWSKAKAKKVITSDTPEGLVKRDEFIAVLGRLDLIE